MKFLNGRRVYVQSAGVRGNGPVNGFAVEVLGEAGIDISGHHPRSFDEMEAYGEDFTAYEVFVSFTPAAHRRALEYTRTAALRAVYWPMLDPSVVEGSHNQCIEAFRHARDVLWRRILSEFGSGGS